MTLQELNNNRLIEVRKLENFETLIETETRQLNDNENIEVENIKKTIENIDLQIVEKRNENKKITIKNNNNTMNENFSLLNTIRSFCDRKDLTDLQKNVIEFGQKEIRNAGLSYDGTFQIPFEFRDIQVDATGKGVEAVSEQKFDILEPLRANLVFTQAGATLLPGLVGDVSIPVYGGATAAWATESGDTADGSGTFSEITLTPKRLTTQLIISKKFLNQNSPAAEAMLRNDLVRAVQGQLEATLLGTAAGSTTQPAGLFYGASYTVSGTTSFSGVVSMETALANNNALQGSPVYLIHPTTVGIAKTTAKSVSGSTFLIENGTINGYKYITTTAMPAINDGKTAVFGNFSDYIIGNWGSSYDITVDPYTLSTKGQVRIVINSYWDAKPRRSASFAFAVLK
jgi:HK97 family phage major capsid protein